MLKADPRTWDEGTRCNECCNGDRCDDPEHHERRSCPYCWGTGWALWTEAGRADYIARGYGTEACIAAAQQSRYCHGEWVRPGGKCRFCGDHYARLRDPTWRTALGVPPVEAQSRTVFDLFTEYREAMLSGNDERKQEAHLFYEQARALSDGVASTSKASGETRNNTEN